MNITGRIEEKAILEECYQSDKSHFVAVYGRRRVGKTFLIKTIFKNRIFFSFTGIAKASLQRQISNFNFEINNQLSQHETEYVRDWFEAFQLLRKKITDSKQKKKVIFIDELPWLDSRNSGFVQALEHFWNGWANMRNDVLLIGCGSAASWMIHKLINNKGGLHNRVTKRLIIKPFTIAETASFLKTLGAKFNLYQIVNLYMVFGGIPYYLEQIKPQWSDVQNINALCFGPDAFFQKEFDLLFKSLFSKSERHMAIIAALAKKGSGMTRTEILDATKLDTGGTTTAIFKELEESHFIRKYPALGKKEKDQLYQLIDFYSLFYLNHIAKTPIQNSNYWTDLYNTPKYYTWAGYAFELVCLLNADAIKKSLGISGISSEVYSWRNQEAQIDLIIDRRDHVINLCEIKFSIGKYKMTKNYAAQIQKKVNSFITSGAGNNKAIFPTIITTYGLENTIHNGIFMNSLELKDIF